MSGMAIETVSERLTGGQPSRAKALAVSVMAALAAGVTTYKVLRSGDGDRRQDG
jgi:hypothetical protein